MSDKRDKATEKQPRPHMAGWQYGIAGLATAGAAAGGLYRAVDQALFEHIEQSKGFAPTREELLAQRDFVHDREGRPLYAYPFDSENPSERRVVEATADGKYLLRPDSGATPHKYTKKNDILRDAKNEPILAEDWKVHNHIWRVEHGKIVHQDGQVVHVNGYGRVIPSDQLMDGERINPTGPHGPKSAPRPLFAADKASEEARSACAKRSTRQRVIKTTKLHAYALEHFGIDMKNPVTMLFHGFDMLTPYAKAEVILSATVASVVAGAGVLMFFNSQNQGDRSRAVNRKLDHITALQEQRANQDKDTVIR
jgi:hypothetical protein